MDFETFRENLARDIKEALEARTGTDFEVEHRPAEKVNGNYEASLYLFFSYEQGKGNICGTDKGSSKYLKIDSLVQKNLCQIHRIVTQKYHR